MEIVLGEFGAISILLDFDFNADLLIVGKRHLSFIFFYIPSNRLIFYSFFVLFSDGFPPITCK